MSDPDAAGGRWIGVVAAGLVGICIAAFLTALLTSAPVPAAAVVVVASRALPAAGAFAVRVHAVSARQTGLRSVTGTATLGEQTVALDAGVARFAASPAPPSGAEPVLRLDLRVDGGAQQLTALLPTNRAGGPAPPPQASPWAGEVLFSAGSTPKGAPAVYPLDGRVPSRLAAAVLLVDAAGATLRLALPPNAAGPQLPDGRRLRVDRSNVRIDATRAFEPGPVRVALTTAEPRTLALDVIADGVLLDSHIVQAVGTTDVRIDVPSALDNGTPLTVRVAEPLAESALAHHLGCVVPVAADSAAVGCLLEWAARAPQLKDDPLVAVLGAAAPPSPEAVQALGARFVVATDAPVRVRAVPVPSRGVAFWARAVFAGAALSAVLATAWLAARRGRSLLDRVLLVAVAAALLGGLGLILVLTA